MAIAYVPYEGPVVTRAEAKAAGLPRYFEGFVCKRGHTSERYSSNANCVACNQLGTWRLANKARFIAGGVAWRHANKERFEAKAKIWRAANKQLLYEARKRREAKNRDKERVRRNALRAANPLRWLCYRENRRARKLAAGGRHTPAQIAALAALQRHKCPNCGASIRNRRFEIDHIVALSKGGSNDIRNIQLLCKPCNRSKHTKDPIVWAQEQGRLL